MDNQRGWPEPPVIESEQQKFELLKLRYQTQLDLVKAVRQEELERSNAEHQTELDKAKAEHQAEIERAKTKEQRTQSLQQGDYEHEHLLDQKVHDAYISVASAQLDRAITRADFVQKAAAALGGAYVAILGLSFSVAGENSSPLPARGLAPTIFLGLAIFLAAAYVAFLTKPGRMERVVSDGTLSGLQRVRLKTFVDWTSDSVLRRRHFLQASVISLGLGVVFLPAPYLDVSEPLIWRAVIVGLIVVVAVPFMVYRIIERKATER